MNKDIIIVILVVSVLASTGAAIYFSQKGPVIVGQETTKELCGALPLYTGAFGGGSTPPPTIAQDICYFVFANEKGEAATCGKIKSSEFRASCFAALAAKTGDISLCESAPADVRDRCYQEASSNMGNIAACEKIQSVNAKDSCLINYANRQGDATVCPKITDSNMRDSCYMNQAFKNPELCQKVANVTMRRDCEQNVRR